MADNSTLMSDTGRSLLADSSILDSKITESSKENLFRGSASDGEGNGVNGSYFRMWIKVTCYRNSCNLAMNLVILLFVFL